MKFGKMAIGLVALLLVTLLVGCASKPKTPEDTERDRAIARAKPIRTEPAQEPSWKNKVPDSPTTLSFIGSAGRYATATGNSGARYYAEENGRSQLVSYYGTLMSDQARTFIATYGISSEVFAPQTAGQQLNERIVMNVSQSLAAREYYTEVYLDETNREAFEVYVLMQIDKSIVRRVIDNYGKEQAADYAKRAAAEQDTVRKQQLERTSEFYGGNLSSRLNF